LLTSIEKAIALIASGNRELINILLTTARVSITSSVIALIIGVPIGIWLGSSRKSLRTVLIVINRTLMGIPPVLCGLLFYLLFSGVGPFRHLKLLFTVPVMIIAQIFLITPIVVGNTESFTSSISDGIRETSVGLGLGRFRAFLLTANESIYNIISTYLLAFARAIAEVGAVSMVGGAIAWKTNVMTTAIMQYTNRGDFSLGIAIGLILLAVSLIINTAVTCLQRRVSK